MRLPSAPTACILAGLTLCLLWGVFILPGLGLGGFGRGASPRLLAAAAAPPSLASLLLLGGGVLRLRRRRTAGPGAGSAVPAAAAIALGVVVGLFGLSLFQAGR